MDKHNPMNQAADMMAATDDPWANPVNILNRYIETATRRAEHHDHRVTAGGDRDMNAPLVESTRALANLNVALELRGLVNEVAAAQESMNRWHEQRRNSSNLVAFEQGEAAGYAKAQAEGEARPYENPFRVASQARLTSETDAVAHAGWTASWEHSYQDAQGNKIQTTLYGEVTGTVHADDEAVVIKAGQDQLLIGFKRLAFAPDMAQLAAKQELRQGTRVHEESYANLVIRDVEDGEGELRVWIGDDGLLNLRMHHDDRWISLAITQQDSEDLAHGVSRLFARLAADENTPAS